jgi:hypothetical protein
MTGIPTPTDCALAAGANTESVTPGRRVATTLAFLEFLRECEDLFRDLKRVTQTTPETFAKALESARSLPSVANWFGMQTVIITEMQKVLVGQESAKQAADSMAKQIDAIIAQK